MNTFGDAASLYALRTALGVSSTCVSFGIPPTLKNLSRCVRIWVRTADMTKVCGEGRGPFGDVSELSAMGVHKVFENTSVVKM